MSPFERHDTGRIFCFWHSRLLPMAFLFRNTSQTAVVSRSSDGRFAADIARMWNHDIVAGSSHRGGSSVLRQCTKVLRRNGSVALTPDGPRGPREIVKPGVAQLAHLSNAPVVLLSAHPKSAWYLKSWDSFMVPKPFSHITITISDPISSSMVKEMQDPVDHLRKNIQEKLDESTRMA